MLIYTIHSTNKKPFKLFGTNLDNYKAFAMDLKFGKYPALTCIPSGIIDNVRLMLHYNPDTRPNLYELLKVISIFTILKKFFCLIYIKKLRRFLFRFPILMILA